MKKNLKTCILISFIVFFMAGCNNSKEKCFEIYTDQIILNDQFKIQYTNEYKECMKLDSENLRRQLKACDSLKKPEVIMNCTIGADAAFNNAQFRCNQTYNDKMLKVYQSDLDAATSLKDCLSK